MARTRLLSFLATVIFVLVVGFIASFIARGWRLDTKKLTLRPTGLLVATSVPDGAQILVNGELESATNATISLPPDTYDVEIKKDTFLPWQKRLTIKKEEVTKVDTILFPVAPSLSPLTFNGAIKPVLSPDGTKVAYAQTTGLWITDIADLPIGFSKEPRQVTDATVSDTTWQWSPDSRQILISSQKGAFLLSTAGLTPQNKLINIQGKQLEEVLAEWKKQEEKKTESKLAKLPPPVKDLLERKSAAFSFSPDDNKILYQASGSAQIPDGLIPQLPGSSTQKQDRDIKSGKTYIYDIKEDRNFLIEEDITKHPVWFPTSNHVVLAEDGKITIMDYDGTNRQIVFSGPYEAPYAIPFPNSTRLLILTRLGAGNGNLPNLYSLSLK